MKESKLVESRSVSHKEATNLATLLCILSQATTNKEKVDLIRSAIQEDSLGPVVKRYLRLVLDPSFCYYMTKKTIPKPERHDASTYIPATTQGMLDMLERLHHRVTTGLAAKRMVADWLYRVDPALRWLFTCCIERQLPGNVGRAIVNEVIPGWIYKQPYGGCTSWDADMVHKRFNFNLGVMLEKKEDGMTLLVDGATGDIRTRSGQDVSKQLGAYISPVINRMPAGAVIHFEAKMLKGDYTGLLPRPEANGNYNAIFKSGRQISPDRLVLTALDMIPRDSFYAGDSYVPAAHRYFSLDKFVSDYEVANTDEHRWPIVDLVECEMVYSLEAARQVVQHWISLGGEGGILKDQLAGWASRKMRSQMKMKNEFECTLMVVGVKPHKKHPEWVGSLLVQSTDGKIKTNVGSGLNEEDGHDFDRRRPSNFYNGMLVEVKAEKISKNNALDLPRLVEVRLDKFEADTYEEVLAAYNDSISIK